MVARIDTSASLSDVMNYNEKKVAQKDAILIHASGFLKDLGRMNFYEKMERFQRQNELNPISESNMLHASLNFHPSDHLSDTQLAKIADRYMEGIGMKDQPYLVYRHTDAGHPHLHIVSTLIRADGSRVKTQNIGKNQSAAIRKVIEKEFELIRANRHQLQESYQVKPIDVQKVQYGNTQETKKAIQNVILMASKHYQFTSLPEYNAILRQWNVYADSGRKDSRMYKRNGLVYRVLDENGKKVGVPIKASSFWFKPTLPELEKKFVQHQASRKDNLEKIRNRIDEVLFQGPSNLIELTHILSQKNIEAAIYHGQGNRPYGITFIDNQLRTAVKGSDLGKDYSVSGLLKAIATGQAPPKSQVKHQSQSLNADHDPQFLSIPQPLSLLLQQEHTHGLNPTELQQDQQKRKRKKL
jgi:hypothetical protein